MFKLFSNILGLFFLSLSIVLGVEFGSVALVERVGRVGRLFDEFLEEVVFGEVGEMGGVIIGEIGGGFKPIHGVFFGCEFIAH